jgi:protein-tyrosine phosphatase
VARLDDGLDLPGQTLTERAGRLVQTMADSRSRRPAGDDDVPDPIGRPLEAHQDAGDLIVAALIPIMQRLVELAKAVPVGTPAHSTASTPS